MRLFFVCGIVAAVASVAAAQDAGGGQAMPTNVTDAETWRYIATQSGLLLALLAVLWSYRRDFLRKDVDRTEALRVASVREAQYQTVIENSTRAITESAVATARQTDATHRLARTVEGLERSVNRRQAFDDRREDGAS